jgi:hypothetical protein
MFEKWLGKHLTRGGHLQRKFFGKEIQVSIWELKKEYWGKVITRGKIDDCAERFRWAYGFMKPDSIEVLPEEVRINPYYTVTGGVFQRDKRSHIAELPRDKKKWKKIWVEIREER